LQGCKVVRTHFHVDLHGTLSGSFHPPYRYVGTLLVATILLVLLVPQSHLSCWNGNYEKPLNSLADRFRCRLPLLRKLSGTASEQKT
jgi:hypothetical protein